MISNFVIFDGDGEIKNTILTTFEVAEINAEKDGLMFFKVAEGVHGSTHRIIDGNCVEKVRFDLITSSLVITANGVDEAIISGIPEGVQVRWPDGQTDIVTDGEIRFSVDLAGTYTFRFTAVPYLDQEVVIEAIPAT